MLGMASVMVLASLPTSAFLGVDAREFIGKTFICPQGDAE